MITAGVTPVKSATPVDNVTSTKYPHLSWALGDEDGYFDQADPSVQKSMQGLLQEINHLLSTKYELYVCAISSNRPILYVGVPIQRQRVITPSQIPKNGLTLPSTSQDCSMGYIWISVSNSQSPHQILYRLIPCRLPDSRYTSHQTNECYSIPSHVECQEGKWNRGKRIEEAPQLPSWQRLLPCPRPTTVSC